VDKPERDIVSLYYQYLSSSNAIVNLERGMVKVSRIKKVNDMFELQPYLRFEKVKRRQFDRIRKKVSDTYGMVCFSTDWHEPIMWAHYADRNKGIVLGFDFISSRFIMREVQYPSQRTKVLLDPGTVSADEYIEAVGFIKYRGWSYEKEHRFFVKLDDCVCIDENHFLALGSDLRLKQVIIGPEHPSKNKRDYVQTARYIAELVKNTGAELIVARAEFGGYRVVRCGLWTPRFGRLLGT
jgi:hypothetical protein